MNTILTSVFHHRKFKQKKFFLVSKAYRWTPENRVVYYGTIKAAQAYYCYFQSTNY